MTETGAQTHGRLGGGFDQSARAGRWQPTSRADSFLGENEFAEASTSRRMTAPPARFLFLILIVSIPLLNPWVHGDGVGYYAYLHSLLIEHNLNFAEEWRSSNPTFAELRTAANGELLSNQYTAIGHVDNHFAVGPAILWAPFVVPVHGAILALRSLGANVSADGYSRPYLWAMALGTLVYGFVGLWLSFQIAREYAGDWWAFWGTVAFWFASSLPVYMYLNPSWSHAHSVFSVALFLWYWRRTRIQRSFAQWMLLGLAAGLMVNVYYLNVILLLVPACESARKLSREFRRGGQRQFGKIIAGNVLFAAVFAAALLPSFITRKIIYGSYWSTGYPVSSEWQWLHPKFATVLFSSDHGLLSWTPVIAIALVGLFFLLRIDREFALYCWITTIAFAYVIACYVNWDGISSFGNRFFLSLGPIFVIGLAAFFERMSRVFASRRVATTFAAAVVTLFSAWNFGFIFQWGSHMVPVRGPISWSEMARNQFTEVPARIWGAGEMYLLHRKNLLNQIERKDLEELRQRAGGAH